MAPRLPSHTENIVGLIVPSPTDLQIALPSDQAFVESLPVKMVRAKIRESLSLTLPPYETHWAWTSLVYHLDGKTTWTIERNQVMTWLRSMVHVVLPSKWYTSDVQAQ